MNKPKLLVVDDESKNLYATRRILEDLDIEIVEAASGQEALRHAFDNEFFVVLMDVQMPNMDGFETAALMLEEEKTSHTPIVFVTAINKEKRFFQKGYKTGAVDYLLKPLDPEILIAKVRVFLELYHRRIKTQDLVKGLEAEISERKRAEKEMLKIQKQLFQSQKMETIGALAGGIAHDLNNILGSILGYSDLILRSSDKSSRNYQYQTQIQTAAYRAASLVKQILTFSSPVQNNHSLIEINSIIKEATKLLRSTLPSTIELRVNIDPECGSVIGDATQLHQVIMNLCTNALHAMENRHGTIEVSISPIELDSEFVRFHPNLDEGSYLRITVSDSGSGMDQKTVDQVFEPFFTTKGARGTGLGLSVVHSIIHQHRGEILLYSQIGEGTTFHIYLRQEVSQRTEKEVAVEPMATGTESILLVDDNEMLLETARLMLESLGYRVTTSSDSSLALEIFKRDSGSFDLIIADQTMPKYTGIEFAEKIHEIVPEQPFLLASGFSDRVGKSNFSNCGIDGYVMKPFTIREISQAVTDVLAQVRSRDIPETSDQVGNIAPSKPKARILLADDFADVRLAISTLLEHLGCEISLAENGRAAVDMIMDSEAKGAPFDFVIMDLDMPVLDGYTATSQLREKGYKLPIIGLSGSPFEDTRDKCLEVGCNEYYRKPMTGDVLMELIERCNNNRIFSVG